MYPSGHVPQFLTFHTSPQKLPVMPRQRLFRRSPVRPLGKGDRRAVHGVILAPVLEFLADAPAHLETPVRRHRDIAAIEQLVNIAAEQKAVADFVRAALAVGADMGRFQGRQRPLAGDGAAAIVGIGDGNAERSLPEARRDERGLAVTGLAQARRIILGRRYPEFAQSVSLLDCLPQAHPFHLVGVVFLAHDDVARPVRRYRNPLLAGKEKRAFQDSATDTKVILVAARIAAVVGDAVLHLGQRACAVLDAERVPRKRYRENGSMREDAAADDKIMRAVQLEQEQLAGHQRAEIRSATGLPEIDLVEVLLGPEELEPRVIGYPYVQTDQGLSFIRFKARSP